ncbi:hypothetical protein PC116_g33948 [Phytophthora cactorum]|nr:hypothetical protein PC116_g33948 [Phytophthora cactorum]
MWILLEGVGPLLPASPRHGIAPITKLAEYARHSKDEGSEVDIYKA